MKARVLILAAGLALAALAALRAGTSREMSETASKLESSTEREASAALDGPSIDDLFSLPTPTSEGAATQGSSKVPVENSASARLQAPPFARSFALSMERLRRLRQCERTLGADCPGLSAKGLSAVTDTPAGLMNALADQTAAELSRLKLQAESEMARGQTSSVPVASLSAAYVKHPDDDVREKALDLANLLTASEPRLALKVATHALTVTVSGPLAIKALDILRTTRGTDAEAVDQILLKSLHDGGWDVRDRVAEGILPFITSENRDAFARELSKAPSRSKQALYLRLNLEEFDRKERL